ncbi:hypothetical protein ABW22_03280 [Thiobacillus denitrificans]|uniref:Uncharacterized protein n=1 Tax=Thiobacillus denitrificans TaxID=36861 RepID=A0A106BT17_THIDE|nr:hypothetical protein ABW22_03280 [Thiobacillus denitrificans]
MREHVLPFGEQFSPCVGPQQRVPVRHGDILEGTLLTQGIHHHRTIGTDFVMAVEMHHVVQVSGALPFRQRPDLFGKHLFEAVAQNMNSRFRPIRIRVMNFPLFRFQYQLFFGRQIEFDAGEVASLLEWADVIHAPLGVFSAAPGVGYLEADLVGRNLNTARFINPIRNLTKRREQKIFIELPLFGDGEVQVFRESIGFEVALLEAGSPLEDPVPGKASWAEIPARSQPRT